MSGRRIIDEPVTLKAKRVLRGEDYIWHVIKQYNKRGPWCLADINRETNCRGTQVQNYITKLHKAGIAKKVGETVAGRNIISLYSLARTADEAPRVRSDGTLIGLSRQQRMWNAIRTMRQGFTVRELAFAASLPEEELKEVAAQRYVELLNSAGYMIIVKPRQGRYGLNVWRLKPSMNTGPLSPSIFNVTTIFDRNLKQVMGEGELQEAAS